MYAPRIPPCTPRAAPGIPRRQHERRRLELGLRAHLRQRPDVSTDQLPLRQCDHSFGGGGPWCSEQRSRKLSVDGCAGQLYGGRRCEPWQFVLSMGPGHTWRVP